MMKRLPFILAVMLVVSTSATLHGEKNLFTFQWQLLLRTIKATNEGRIQAHYIEYGKSGGEKEISTATGKKRWKADSAAYAAGFINPASFRFIFSADNSSGWPQWKPEWVQVQFTRDSILDAYSSLLPGPMYRMDDWQQLLSETEKEAVSFLLRNYLFLGRNPARQTEWRKTEITAGSPLAKPQNIVRTDTVYRNGKAVYQHYSAVSWYMDQQFFLNELPDGAIAVSWNLVDYRELEALIIEKFNREFVNNIAPFEKKFTLSTDKHQDWLGFAEIQERWKQQTVVQVHDYRYPDDPFALRDTTVYMPFNRFVSPRLAAESYGKWLYVEYDKRDMNYPYEPIRENGRPAEHLTVELKREQFSDPGLYSYLILCY